MNPNLWGEEGWIFITFVVLAYPDNPTQQDKNNMKEFLLTLENVLPCYDCRSNLATHYREYPITPKVLSSKDNLYEWLNKIRNLVNISLDKKVYNVDESILMINNFIKNKIRVKSKTKINNLNKESKKRKYIPSILTCILLLLFIILIIFAILKERLPFYQ